MKKYLLILLFFYSCIEPYEFSNLDEDNLYVIDGYITDEEKPHIIKVMKTIRFSNEGNPGVEGAEVSILIDNSYSIYLTDIKNGYYSTNSDFKAEPGHSYQLKVITPEGDELYSEVMLLHQQQGNIEDITYETKTKAIINDDGEETEQKLVSFFLHLNQKNNDAYYKWEVKTSWIAKADLAQQFNPAYETCYIDNFKESSVKIWHNDSDFDEQETIKIPLADKEFSYEMKYDYRLHVKQYSIGEDAFVFWEQIKMQQESQGSMFDPIVGSITGNLHMSGSDQRVLGFFGVHAQTQHVIHLNQIDLPFRVVPIECVPDVGAHEPPPVCINCLYNNGEYKTTIKPENW